MGEFTQSFNRPQAVARAMPTTERTNRSIAWWGSVLLHALLMLCCVSAAWSAQTPDPVFTPAAGTYKIPVILVIEPGKVAHPPAGLAKTEIHYTIDGTAPTAASPRFDCLELLADTTTVRARAFCPGFDPSNEVTALYKITFQLVTARPTFAPVAGTYPDTVQVSLACATPHAAILYTTDGSLPTLNSHLYVRPFPVSTATTVRARAVGFLLLPSGVALADYALVTSTPTIAPVPGTYATPQTITLASATPGARIVYTTDGTVPTASSTAYTKPFLLDHDATIAALALRTGFATSAVTRAAYHFQPVAPVITPPGGSYATAVTVAATTTTTGAVVRYTVDGSLPSDTSPLAGAGIIIGSNTTLTARAFRAGWTPSAPIAATYVIATQVATPTINKGSGTYTDTIALTAACATPGAVIRYTTDGSTPVETSHVMPSPLNLAVSETLTLRAFKDGVPPSASLVVTDTFVVATPTWTPTPASAGVGSLAVSAACATSKSVVRYTSDGSDPTDSASELPVPLVLDRTTTLTVRGFRSGFTTSPAVVATYTVTPTIGFAAATSAIPEAVGTAAIAVTLSAPTTRTVTVQYQLAASPGTATPGSDYAFTPGTLTIPAGAVSAAVPLAVINDTVHEESESVVLHLTNAVGASLGQDTTVVTILDDDQPPTVAFASPTVSVSQHAGSASLVVTLSAVSMVPVQVDILPIGGTAVQGQDYVYTGQRLTIPAGVQSASVSVGIVDIAGRIGDLQAIFALSSQTAALLGSPQTMTLTISGAQAYLLSVEWNRTARSLVAAHHTDAPTASRVLALLSIAQDRAAHLHPTAAAAAVVVASQQVLASLYPDATGTLADQVLAERVAPSWPGSATDDVSSPSAPGRAEAALVLARAASDGSQMRWNGVMPSGPGYWVGDGQQPLLPMWGTVRPWFLASGAQLRPQAPPAMGSPAFAAALLAVQSAATRTAQQIATAATWDDGPGTETTPGHWNRIASSLIASSAVDEAGAAHELAVLNAALMDAGIATWDAKYAYWTLRPYQADRNLATLGTRPNTPSYVSAHAAFSAAAAGVLGHQFPASNTSLTTMASDAAIAQVASGLQFPFATDAGLALGAAVANSVLAGDAAGPWPADVQPTVVITSPGAGTVVTNPQPTFTGTITSSLAIAAAGVTAQLVDATGQQTQVSALSITPGQTGTTSFSATPSVALADGLYRLIVTATDAAGHQGTGQVSFGVGSHGLPQITITAPTEGSLVGASAVVTLSGSVNVPAQVTVNGVPIATVAQVVVIGPGVPVPPIPPIGGGPIIVIPVVPIPPVTQASGVTFSQALTADTALGDTASPLALHPGLNQLRIVATDAAGQQATTTLRVRVDIQPPQLVITTPSASSTVTAVTVSVAGTVVDAGNDGGPAPTVTVDGVAAQVDHGSFLATGVALQPGVNVITVQAQDAAGNTSSQSVTVTSAHVPGNRLQLVSGDNQHGLVGTPLAQRLIVRVVDADGAVLPNQAVTFTIAHGDAVLSQTADDLHRVRTVLTAADGTASAQIVLGARSGLGNEQIGVTVNGSLDRLDVVGSASPGLPALLAVIAGNQQRGANGAVLADPLIVIVKDSLGNPVPGATVQFTVTGGLGTLAAADGSGGGATVQATSDANGLATVQWRLGSDTAPEANLVQAVVSGLANRTITFAATGLAQGAAVATVQGRLADDTNRALANVTVRIAGSVVATVSGADGGFSLIDAPPGRQRVEALDATGQVTGFAVPVTVIDHALQQLPRPLIIPRGSATPADGGQLVGGDHDVVLTVPGDPDSRVTVFANSTILPNGTRAPARMWLAALNGLGLPAASPVGAGSSSSLLLPTGIRFDPAPLIATANATGALAGGVVDLWTYDPELGRFVIVGSGTVDADGATITAGTSAVATPTSQIRKNSTSAHVASTGPSPSHFAPGDAGTPQIRLSSMYAWMSTIDFWRDSPYRTDVTGKIPDATVQGITGPPSVVVDGPYRYTATVETAWSAGNVVWDVKPSYKHAELFDVNDNRSADLAFTDLTDVDADGKALDPNQINITAHFLNSSRSTSVLVTPPSVSPQLVSPGTLVTLTIAPIFYDPQGFDPKGDYIRFFTPNQVDVTMTSPQYAAALAAGMGPESAAGRIAIIGQSLQNLGRPTGLAPWAPVSQLVLTLQIGAQVPVGVYDLAQKGAYHDTMHTLSKVLAVDAVALRETRFDVPEHLGQPQIIYPPTLLADEISPLVLFTHVSPLIPGDDVTTNDLVHMDGQVISPVDMVEHYQNRSSPHQLHAYIDNNPLTLTSTGTFTGAQHSLTQNHEISSITAYEGTGGFASARVRVEADLDPEQMPLYHQQVAYQRYSFGPQLGTALGKKLLSLPGIEVRVINADGSIANSTLLGLEASPAGDAGEMGQMEIVTQPFVITTPPTFRAADIGQYGRVLQLTDPLTQRVVLAVNNVPISILRGATSAGGAAGGQGAVPIVNGNAPLWAPADQIAIAHIDLQARNGVTFEDLGPCTDPDHPKLDEFVKNLDVQIVCRPGTEDYDTVNVLATDLDHVNTASSFTKGNGTLKQVKNTINGVDTWILTFTVPVQTGANHFEFTAVPQRRAQGARTLSTACTILVSHDKLPTIISENALNSKETIYFFRIPARLPGMNIDLDESQLARICNMLFLDVIGVDAYVGKDDKGNTSDFFSLWVTDRGARSSGEVCDMMKNAGFVVLENKSPTESSNLTPDLKAALADANADLKDALVPADDGNSWISQSSSRSWKRVKKPSWSTALARAYGTMYDQHASDIAKVFRPAGSEDLPLGFATDRLYVVDARMYNVQNVYGQAWNFTTLFPVLGALVKGLAIHEPFTYLQGNLLGSQASIDKQYPASQGNGPTYVLKKFGFKDYDRRRDRRSWWLGTTKNDLDPANKSPANGVPPRVAFNDPVTIPQLFHADDSTPDSIITGDTKRVFITFHGFNNDTTLSTTISPDEDMLRRYWPMDQYMLMNYTFKQIQKGLNPVDIQTFRKQTAVLHCVWSGDYAPKDVLFHLGSFSFHGVNAGAWFNWDMALAYDVGENVLFNLVQDIIAAAKAKNIYYKSVRLDDGTSILVPDPEFKIILQAESLGSRPVTSLIHRLGQVYPGRLTHAIPGGEDAFPPIRVILGHPALRQIELRNELMNVTEDADQPRFDRLPATPLQHDLAGLNVYQAPKSTSDGTKPYFDYKQWVLAFHSPFDKAGQVYEAPQNGGGWEADYGHTRMLGRYGTPLALAGGQGDNGPLRSPLVWPEHVGNTAYDESTALVKYKSYHANADNDFADLWHVDAMGWYLPGAQWESRFTYSWNRATNMATRTYAVLAGAEGIYQMSPNHLDPIWQAIGQYAVTGDLPATVIFGHDPGIYPKPEGTGP